MESNKYSVEQRSILPNDPGIYRLYDKNKTLIYVGKAKNIKKRVSSYFNNAKNSIKTKKMISQIHYIEYTVVNSEFEALLLENNIIKNNIPKYNILLRDDKTYPYLCILKERFPRITSVRKVDKSKGLFFGPFTNVNAINKVMELIKDIYKVRTCNLNLSEKNIEKKNLKYA